LGSERWRHRAAYLNIIGQDDADFAWEALRRDHEFRRQVVGAAGRDQAGDALAAWGLTFRPGPQHPGRARHAGHLAA